MSLMADCLLRNLGLCRRANKIVSGDALMRAIRSQSVYLVIVASDTSARSIKQFSNKCHYYQIPMLLALDRESLSRAVGYSHRVAVGISDKGLSTILQNCIKERGDAIHE